MFLNKGRQESRIFEVSNRNGEGELESEADKYYQVEGAIIEDIWAISDHEVALKIVGHGTVTMNINNGEAKSWIDIKEEVKDVVKIGDAKYCISTERSIMIYENLNLIG